MADRVNFNRKSNKLNKKYIKIAIMACVIIIINLLIKNYSNFYKDYKNNTSSVQMLHYSIDEYDSLSSLLYGYETEYIRIDESGEIDKIYVAFSRNLYTGGDNSNQKHFEGIVKVVADYREFANFELIDLTRNIEIKVTCQDESITQIIVNGDENYFLNCDSEINSNKSVAKTTIFEIQSEELLSLIQNDWNDSNIKFGTQESRCEEYAIYFDEGIKYKKVAGKVFNLIFTEKYEKPVVNNLYITSTPEEVEKVFGTPTFSQFKSLYGYVSEEHYLFFDFINKKISIYPVQNVTKEEEEFLIEFIKKMNESQDVKFFVSNLMELWLDYDEYDYDENYVDLKYTLRGVELKLSEANLGDDGIFIYQNYSGDRKIQDLENVYISNKDSVFELEKDRITQDVLSREEMSYESEEELRARGVEFSIRFRGDLGTGENGYKGPMFFSRDKSYPDSELDRTLVISSYNWYDDYRLAYSIDNDGIYIYDCKTRVNVKVIDVDGNIIINEATDGKILYNDDKEIEINIQ